MSVIPTFYLSSRKENPKADIKLTIKDINEFINIDLDSDMELSLVLNEIKYILKLTLKFNINEQEPIIDVNYNLIEQEDCLLSFMNGMKNKIGNIIEEKNKKVEELESITKLKNKRLKEFMELEENINKMQLEKDLLLKEKLKQEEDLKIFIHNQQVMYKVEQNVLLKELVNKIMKLEEEIKIRNSFYIEDITDEEYNRIMQELKVKNSSIEEENKKLEEENISIEEKLEKEKISTQHDKEVKSKKFDQGKIISYIKEELENINKDEKELETLNENDEKINELKEKYEEIPKFIPKEIINDPNNESFRLEEEIYEHLKLIISDDLNMIYTNLIYVITELMKFVETFNMEGFDKKQFIIDSIKKFLIYQKMDSPETNFILDTVCPELIEILLLVDKRKIIIRKKLNCFIPWCA